jgi:hypothetical protein
MSTTAMSTEVSPEGRTQPPADVLPLAKHVLNSLQLAVEKAVAHDASPSEFPLPGGDSLEAAIVQRLRERPEQSRIQARERIMPMVRADAAARARHYGDLGQVDLRRSASVLQQTGSLAPKLMITSLKLEPGGGPAAVSPPGVGGLSASAAFGGLSATDGATAAVSHPGVGELSASAAFGGLSATGDVTAAVSHPGADGLSAPGGIIVKPRHPSVLELRLREIRCIDETDGFLGSELGVDEIALGVIRLDPDAEVVNLGPLNITGPGGGFFPFEANQNNRRVYDPPQVLASWNASDDSVVMLNGQPMVFDGQQVKVGWPRTYGATLVLAEIDNGGFPESLRGLVDQARTYIMTQVVVKVAQATADKVGDVAGGAIGSVAGSLVSSAAEWILSEFIDFLIGIWQDDVFPAVTPRTVRTDPTSTNAGSGMYWVKAHGGKYEIYFDWHTT